MGWGTAQTFYSYNRKCQAYVSASITSQTDTTATITVTGYARSGDGSGYYYATDFGVNVEVWSKLGSASWVKRAAKTATLNYGDHVGSSTVSFTVNKTSSTQMVTLQTEALSTTGDWPKAKATVTLTVPAKSKYTVSFNANGGSGAPSSQTKYHGETLTISNTKPTRTGYTFQGWGTSSNASNVAYNPGSAYTANSSTTLYAIWKIISHTIAYNANKPSQASDEVSDMPANGTKNYGTTYTIPSVPPSLLNYNFLGWSTDASGLGPTYSPGASYSDNANLTLYAQWELAYSLPTISSMSVYRADSDGEPTDNGAYAKAIVNWSVDDSVDAANEGYQVVIAGKARSEEAFSVLATIDLSGASGTVDTVLGGSFSADTAYDIVATVYDNHFVEDGVRGSASARAVLSPAFYTMDVKAGGKGIAFGGPANNDQMDIFFPLHLQNSIFEIHTDLDANAPETHQAPAIVLSGMNEAPIGQLIGVVDAGRVSAGLVSQTMGTDGEVKQNRILAYIDENGACSYEVTDPASFRAAISDATPWVYIVGSESTVMTGNYVRWRVQSGIMFVQIMYRSGAGVGTSEKAIGSLPSAYAPSVNTYLPAYLGASASTPGNTWIYANTGVIGIRGGSSSNAFFSFGSYPLD